MKKNIVRISSLVLLFTMLFSLAACTGSNSSNEQILYISMLYDENSPYKPNGSASVGSNNISSGNNTQSSGNAAATPSGDNNAAATPSGDNNSAAPSGDNNSAAPSGDNNAAPSGDNNAASNSNLPSTPDDIMKKYTEVTHDMKTKLKRYNKKEYQEVQNLDVGAASSIVNSLIPNFVTSADKAELQDKDNAGSIPPWSETEGSLFTDGSFVKSASCKDNGDGTATIVITLKDEKNPEPASEGVSPSETGKMFSPLKKKDIDDTLAGLPINVQNFELNYRDCTATLVYDTTNNQVKSLTEVMNIDIVASLKVVVTINATGTVVNTIEITNIQY